MCLLSWSRGGLVNDLHSKFFPHYRGVPIKSNTLYLSLPYLQSLCKSPCGPLSTKQSVVERSSWAEGGLQPSSWYSSVMSETIRNVHQEELLLWQFLLLTKYKICTGLPRNIMAGYEEDELHCYRSISSRFCLNATYRLNIGLHWLNVGLHWSILYHSALPAVSL